MLQRVGESKSFRHESGSGGHERAKRSARFYAGVASTVGASAIVASFAIPTGSFDAPKPIPGVTCESTSPNPVPYKAGDTFYEFVAEGKIQLTDGVSIGAAATAAQTFVEEHLPQGQYLQNAVGTEINLPTSCGDALG